MLDFAAKIPSEDQIKLVREMWRHEDNLVSNRVTWLAVFNSFLMGAFAAGWGKCGFYPILVGIATCGLLISFSAGVSLFFSYKAMNSLSDLWRQWFGDGDAVPTPLFKGYTRKTWFDKMLWCLLPWIMLPTLCITGWSCLLAYVIE